MNKITRIHNGSIVYGEAADTIKPTETAANANREAMKVNHRGDMLQRNETEYYKKYPEQLENLSPELRRLLS